MSLAVTCVSCKQTKSNFFCVKYENNAVLFILCFSPRAFKETTDNLSMSRQFISSMSITQSQVREREQALESSQSAPRLWVAFTSVVVWLLGEGLRTFPSWSRLACFCTCTVLRLIPSPDRRSLGVFDLERVLCRSSVDRGVVCRTLVLPLSSFFCCFLLLVDRFSISPFDFPPVVAPSESVSLFFFLWILFKTALSVSSVMPCLFTFSAHNLICAYRDVMALSQTAWTKCCGLILLFMV